MKKCDPNDPIVYSSEIENMLVFFSQCKDKFKECKSYMDEANNETQDILHTIELCNCTVQERNKLFKALSEIRRKRRLCKNEESVLAPIMEWMRNHEKEIQTLQQLLGTLRGVESSVNGEKFYRSRSDVFKNIFGTDSILDVPSEMSIIQDGKDVEDVPSESSIIDIDTYNDTLDEGLKEGRVLKTLYYPVVIFHTRKKKSSVYYYTFPGVESPIMAHTFNSGDPVLNIKNKKLMADIATTFNEIMLRRKRNIPYPISAESVYPNAIKSELHISSITEIRQIYQEYKCYCREDEIGERNPAV